MNRKVTIAGRLSAAAMLAVLLVSSAAGNGAQVESWGSATISGAGGVLAI